mgnify:CR=1 FL=1
MDRDWIGDDDMENFVFENSTKAYFGKHCVGQYLPELLSHYGKKVMVAYGGGSIKRTGIMMKSWRFDRGRKGRRRIFGHHGQSDLC